MKQCRRCRQFKHYDNIFGYCWKYNAQALLTDNCDTIKNTSPDQN